MTDLDNPLESELDPLFNGQINGQLESELERPPETRLETQLETQLEQLASHLVWKMGRDEETDEVVVRVGFASSTPSFAAKGRLKAMSDEELQEALSSQHVRIQWME